MKAPVKSSSWILSSVGLLLTGLLLAGAMGGLTNSINGWINPLYFVAVMRWQNMDDVWWAGVAEGLADGIMTGFAPCAIFTLGIALISRGECPLALSLRLPVHHFWLGFGVLDGGGIVKRDLVAAVSSILPIFLFRDAK